jgi:ElaB/YqjD/DUF883 family membrane-anchored ribosome-binding protein
MMPTVGAAPAGTRAAARRVAGSNGERLAAVRTRARDTERRLRERARRSPLLALGVTAAAGFVVGRILSGRR